MALTLRDLQFSDLLLYGDGSARLKGCGTDPKLLTVPPDCVDEVQQLKRHITEALLAKKDAITVRTEFSGVRYRVAQTTDVNRGNIWFLRRLADHVPELESLNVGDRYGSGHFAVMAQWLLAPEQTQGLVLISGPQASGKTTVASAYVARRLTLYGGHGVTFENPAELPLAGDWGDGGCCFQVEINSEDELGHQIERAHRYASPNIIFIGEIRTKYAAREALRVALGSSRQIVVATIHGMNIIAALQRLTNWAKELDGENALDNLASSLLAVIHLSLEENNGKPTVQIPAFLQLPFPVGNDAAPPEIHSIRSKLKTGQLQGLTGEINAQNSRMSQTLRVAQHHLRGAATL